MGGPERGESGSNRAGRARKGPSREWPDTTAPDLFIPGRVGSSFLGLGTASGWHGGDCIGLVGARRYWNWGHEPARGCTPRTVVGKVWCGLWKRLLGYRHPRFWAFVSACAAGLVLSREPVPVGRTRARVLGFMEVESRRAESLFLVEGYPGAWVCPDRGMMHHAELDWGYSDCDSTPYFATLLVVPNGTVVEFYEFTPHTCHHHV